MAHENVKTQFIVVNCPSSKTNKPEPINSATWFSIYEPFNLNIFQATSHFLFSDANESSISIFVLETITK